MNKRTFPRSTLFSLIYCVCICLAGFTAHGQETHFTKEIGFADYLIENKAYRDAITVLQGLSKDSTVDAGQADSLNYFLAWSFFNQKNVDSSFTYFAKVQKPSAFFTKSLFYHSFGKIYREKRGEALGLLSTLPADADSSMQQVRAFQEAGIALLDRDFNRYSMLAKKLEQPYYPISAEVKNFEEYHQELLKVRQRSPWVAGMLSAVVPGAGKFYAGYKMQGLAAFVQVATFGAAAAESYFKKGGGPQSARFIALGSLFSIFYIGNIWGSALSVKIYRDERFKEIDQSILVDLRVPLVRIFP